MKKENQEDPILISPLNLLYSAYTNDRLPASCVIDEHFKNLDKPLAPLPEKVQTVVFQTFCDIYMENERMSFLEGVRTGVRLMRELEKDNF